MAQGVTIFRPDTCVIDAQVTVAPDTVIEPYVQLLGATIAALLGTPLVIVYKESTINWHALGSLITTEHYGLVNLIAGRRLATELIQDQLNGASLARELLELLDPERNAAMRGELKEVAEKIGDEGASDRAAQAILDFIS